MNVYLDDVRPCPVGYTLTKTAQECIELLKGNHVEYLSLDHDLGDDDKYGTGYDVIEWIEEQAYLHDYHPPVIKVHSSNTSARKKMELGVCAIEKHLLMVGKW